ncbi:MULTISPECIES: YebY family protein [unclassified Leifsonia]|uniref:YebY family protein n=2 Tax=unclassified Leifsonia TaxID=2663824 RepID=UPI001E478085|nr:MULTISPECIES: YebY family protein [unclassified Leifsonia]
MSAPAAPAMSAAESIAIAEQAAKDALPDAPIWKGMTFKGVMISESQVCVDRTWAPGGGPNDDGGNAGYVVVTLPSKKMGEPQDGLCSDMPSAVVTTPPVVNVPSKLRDDPGLLVSTDFGRAWPLTVPYVIVGCKSITAGGQRLHVVSVTDPDGKTYAGNGSAKDHTDLPAIDPIWAPDPDVGGLKVDNTPVVDAGLELCD